MVDRPKAPADPHAIPAPPAISPQRLPALATQPLDRSWRIHEGQEALARRNYPRGKFRFDAPRGEFPVTYVNFDSFAVYAEAFGDAGEIPPSAAKKRLTEIQAHRPLRVVSLDEATTWKAFGLDLRVCSTLDYERTQLWSEALHRWYPNADGIRYLGRHAGRELNLCLFLDRCATALAASDLGDLAKLRRHGLVAAERYRLVPRLFLEA